MFKVEKITLFTLLLFALLIIGLILYILGDNKENKKAFVIEPIKIAPLIIKEEATTPTDILSKLKIAVSTSKENTPLEQEILPSKIITKAKIQRTKPRTIKVKPKIYSKKITVKKSIVKVKKKHITKVKKKTTPQQLSLDTLPDSYYFEPLEILPTTQDNKPLAFVKKLGVVHVSNEYESNFSISKKVELAKEGIVNISSASHETAEMRNLEFVDTLGVVETSVEFETIEADKYLQ